MKKIICIALFIAHVSVAFPQFYYHCWGEEGRYVVFQSDSISYSNLTLKLDSGYWLIKISLTNSECNLTDEIIYRECVERQQVTDVIGVPDLLTWADSYGGFVPGESLMKLHQSYETDSLWEKLVYQPLCDGIWIYGNNALSGFFPLWYKEVKDNRLHGVSKVYYPNGQLESFYQFRNGFYHGSVCHFYNNGEVKGIDFYNMGTGGMDGGTVAMNNYTENGLLWLSMRKGEKFTSYYTDTGIKYKECKVNNKGLLHGEMYIWNEKGEVIQIINFINGVVQGKSIYFDDKGNLIRIEIYKDEKLEETIIIE